jgi:hypothetical protein
MGNRERVRRHREKERARIIAETGSEPKIGRPRELTPAQRYANKVNANAKYRAETLAAKPPHVVQHIIDKLDKRIEEFQPVGEKFRRLDREMRDLHRSLLKRYKKFKREYLKCETLQDVERWHNSAKYIQWRTSLDIVKGIYDVDAKPIVDFETTETTEKTGETETGNT